MNKQGKDESLLIYYTRLTEAMSAGLITYEEYGRAIFGDSIYAEDNVRKMYYCLKEILPKLLEDKISQEELVKQMQNIKFELSKERKKVQVFNNEYNALARNEARTELFQELCIEAINKLEPLEIKCHKIHKPAEKTGLLTIADAHLGSTFTLKGLFDEVVNEYSPEIYKIRMEYLLSQMNNEQFAYDKLVVFDLGDAIEGILRIGSLNKLSTGVIDACLQYASYMATWLNEVANTLQIPVEYHLVGGNHDILRLLTEKPIFDEENAAKVIHEFITLRLQGEQKNPNVTIQPYAEVIYKNLYGLNIFAYHGSKTPLKDDIEFFENFYRVEIDIMMVAHMHHKEEFAIGIGNMGDREVMRVPSIIGTDSFSKKCRKSSRAGAKFILFTEDGKELEKVYYLN